MVHTIKGHGAMWSTHDKEPPTEQLFRNVRADVSYTAGGLVSSGSGKVARVRIEVEFGNGEAIVHEIKVPSLP